MSKRPCLVFGFEGLKNRVSYLVLWQI